MTRRLDSEEISRQLSDLPGWRQQGDSLLVELEAADFPSAVALVSAVAEDAEEMNHHPDIDIRYRRVRFTLSTHSEGGVTQLDVELAHRISGHAARWGAEVPEQK